MLSGLMPNPGRSPAERSRRAGVSKGRRRHAGGCERSRKHDASNLVTNRPRRPKNAVVESDRMSRRYNQSVRSCAKSVLENGAATLPAIPSSSRTPATPISVSVSQSVSSSSDAASTDKTNYADALYSMSASLAALIFRSTADTGCSSQFVTGNGQQMHDRLFHSILDATFVNYMLRSFSTRVHGHWILLCIQSKEPKLWQLLDPH